MPTSGEAFIASHSILSAFSQGAAHLGVVTQNNSLWARLSVQDHLYLFARLRGVPEDLVAQVVNATIDQLELTPHRSKLAMHLSGGMKRKLCVAIALVGDPEVVLLDEPSAGLDPVSRRNLWSVILKTMSHRAVILTTHSMEEAEALVSRGRRRERRRMWRNTFVSTPLRMHALHDAHRARSHADMRDVPINSFVSRYKRVYERITHVCVVWAGALVTPRQT